MMANRLPPAQADGWLSLGSFVADRAGGSLYAAAMRCPDPHHAVLRRQWAAEKSQLERRRSHLLAAADLVAAGLKCRWPGLAAVWLFGSARNGQRFRRHSDLDLAVEGLPPADQSQALGLVEQLVDRAMAAAGEASCGIDLVRLEDLDEHWCERIRQKGQRLA